MISPYEASKHIHYETCPGCGEEFDIDTIDTDDDFIFGCCDHLPLKELLEYCADMSRETYRAMSRLDRAANSKNGR